MERQTAQQFATASEAIRFAKENKPIPILMDGKFLTVLAVEAEYLEATGVEFAYLHEYHGNVRAIELRRVRSVPVD
jgi:hypothetical protein